MTMMRYSSPTLTSLRGRSKCRQRNVRNNTATKYAMMPGMTHANCAPRNAPQTSSSLRARKETKTRIKLMAMPIQTSQRRMFFSF